MRMMTTLKKAVLASSVSYVVLVGIILCLSLNSYAKPRVGASVEPWCTKCKLFSSEPNHLCGDGVVPGTGKAFSSISPGLSVYAKGSDFPAGTSTVTVYVVPDQDWKNGDKFGPTKPNGAQDVTPDGPNVILLRGNHLNCTRVWKAPLIPGYYDLVVDVDGNGVFDKDVDGIDGANDTGFRVLGDPPTLTAAKKKSGACVEKYKFRPGDTVHVYGMNLYPNALVHVYAFLNRKWTLGDAFGPTNVTSPQDVTGGAEQRRIASDGTLCKKIWDSAVAGKYDIFLDVNRDGTYNRVDVIIDEDCDHTFFVKGGSRVNSAKKKPKCKPLSAFAVGKKVFAKGKGFTPSTTVDAYVFVDRDWAFGDIFGPTNLGGPQDTSSDGVETLTVNAKGKIRCKKVWGSATEGAYDLFIDANQDGTYNDNDAVDGECKEVGFTVE